MKQSEKLLKKIRKEFPELNIPEDAYIQRTYAGYDQLDKGAFKSFYMSDSTPFFTIGLFETVKYLLKCPNLVKSVEYGTNYVDCGCIGKCKGIRK